LSTFTITFHYKVKLLYNSKSTATGTLGRRISPAARPYTPTGNVFHKEKSQLHKIPPFPFPLLWTDLAGFFLHRGIYRPIILLRGRRNDRAISSFLSVSLTPPTLPFAPFSFPPIICPFTSFLPPPFLFPPFCCATLVQASVNFPLFFHSLKSSQQFRGTLLEPGPGRSIATLSIVTAQTCR